MINIQVSSYLKLGDHSNFTEAFRVWDSRLLVYEDLVEEGIVRLLKQADQFWWDRVLTGQRKLLNGNRWTPDPTVCV